MIIRTFIVDDELLARRRILHQLNQWDNFSVIGESSNGEDAIKEITISKPDLLFLDINLKDMTGFNVLKNVQLSEKTKIIIVSAYDNYAINAFEVYAFDFILKPIENERFKNTLKRILAYFELNNESISNYQKKNHSSRLSFINEKSRFDKLPYSVGNKIKFIPFINIKYILASGSYCEIYMESDKKIVLRNSLNNIINLLDKTKFHRVHRSTIINIDYLNEIICSSYLETDVRMHDNKIFRVSKSKRKEIFSILGVQ